MLQDKILRAFRDYYEIYSRNPELVIVHPETFYDIMETTFSSAITAREDGLYIEGSVVKRDPYMKKGKMVLTDLISTTQNLGEKDRWMWIDLI